ncbi:hypothetical protein [Aneurinibacillus aneurinilyticus]|uniref:hypothetical protein n=1 Tax=Aneurinibacillus aneurinilyticus TaxID=1391 RepID=UPI0023F595F0|nr:hypothetical protein [Aneurinibacillus aneurinilyticus]
MTGTLSLPLEQLPCHYPFLICHPYERKTPLIYESNTFDIQKFYSKKTEEGLSASYIKQLHSILTKTFRSALEWGLIEKNVMIAVKAPKIQKKNMAIWNMKEANQFLEHVKARNESLQYLILWCNV